jgi:hypothetical protein
MRKILFAISLFTAAGSLALAGPITYTATLNGANEAPPNASPGTGFATVIIDTTAHTLFVDFSYSGLLGTTTASHIHCCTATPGVSTAGVATVTPTFTGMILGVTSGSYTNTFDTSLASAWNPTYITNNGGTPLSAEAALAAGLAGGKAYLNIHSSVVGGGEIRGFLQPVPEPGTVALMLGGLAVMAGLRRRAKLR